jgi:hypothetical protein
VDEDGLSQPNSLELASLLDTENDEEGISMVPIPYTDKVGGNGVDGVMGAMGGMGEREPPYSDAIEGYEERGEDLLDLEEEPTYCDLPESTADDLRL